MLNASKPLSLARSVSLAREGIESVLTTGASRNEPSCSTLLTQLHDLVPKVRPFRFSLHSFSYICCLGIQDALQAFGASRAAFDRLCAVMENLRESMTLAHDRLSRDFTSLRDSVVDPSVFFQTMLTADPDLVITYDVLAYYATLFAWDSTLNFRSVIDGHSSIEEWLRSHGVPLISAASIPQDNASVSSTPTDAEIFGDGVATVAGTGSPEPAVGVKLGVDVDTADASPGAPPTV